MALEPQPYTTLPGARFQPLARELGFERYNLLEVSDDSVNYEDLFGGLEVDFVVHDGTLELSGPTYVRNEDQRVYVIEGGHRGAIYLPESMPDPLEGDALVARLAPTLDPQRNLHQALCEHVLAGQPLLRD